MPIKGRRARCWTAALNGSLKDADFRTDPLFRLFGADSRCPASNRICSNPFKTWKDKAEFDKTARELVGMFQKNSPASKAT